MRRGCNFLPAGLPARPWWLPSLPWLPTLPTAVQAGRPPAPRKAVSPSDHPHHGPLVYHRLGWELPEILRD
jgi:hypothetical protein